MNLLTFYLIYYYISIQLVLWTSGIKGDENDMQPATALKHYLNFTRREINSLPENRFRVRNFNQLESESRSKPQDRGFIPTIFRYFSLNNEKHNSKTEQTSTRSNREGKVEVMASKISSKSDLLHDKHTHNIKGKPETRLGFTIKQLPTDQLISQFNSVAGLNEIKENNIKDNHSPSSRNKRDINRKTTDESDLTTAIANIKLVEMVSVGQPKLSTEEGSTNATPDFPSTKHSTEIASTKSYSKISTTEELHTTPEIAPERKLPTVAKSPGKTKRVNSWTTKRLHSTVLIKHKATQLKVVLKKTRATNKSQQNKEYESYVTRTAKDNRNNMGNPVRITPPQLAKKQKSTKRSLAHRNGRRQRTKKKVLSNFTTAQSRSLNGDKSKTSAQPGKKYKRYPEGNAKSAQRNRGRRYITGDITGTSRGKAKQVSGKDHNQPKTIRLQQEKSQRSTQEFSTEQISRSQLTAKMKGSSDFTTDEVPNRLQFSTRGKSVGHYRLSKNYRHSSTGNEQRKKITVNHTKGQLTPITQETTNTKTSTNEFLNGNSNTQLLTGSKTNEAAARWLNLDPGVSATETVAPQNNEASFINSSGATTVSSTNVFSTPTQNAQNNETSLVASSRTDTVSSTIGYSTTIDNIILHFTPNSEIITASTPILPLLDDTTDSTTETMIDATVTSKLTSEWLTNHTAALNTLSIKEKERLEQYKHESLFARILRIFDKKAAYQYYGFTASIRLEERTISSGCIMNEETVLTVLGTSPNVKEEFLLQTINSKQFSIRVGQEQESAIEDVVKIVPLSPQETGRLKSSMLVLMKVKHLFEFGKTVYPAAINTTGVNGKELVIAEWQRVSRGSEMDVPITLIHYSVSLSRGCPKFFGKTAAKHMICVTRPVKNDSNYCGRLGSLLVERKTNNVLGILTHPNCNSTVGFTPLKYLTMGIKNIIYSW